MSENIRLEIYAKIGVQTALTTSFALLSQLENRRQLAFVLTPKSAVKSSRRTKRIFSFVTTFLILLAHYINRSLAESNHDGYHLFLVLPKILTLQITISIRLIRPLL